MKAKLRKTGEIVDIICYGGSPLNRSNVLDYVNYIDSQGVEHTERNHLNYYWDFEPVEKSTSTDEHWQDIRERAAIAALQGLLANPCRNRPSVSNDYVELAIDYADLLVEKLKKK